MVFRLSKKLSYLLKETRLKTVSLFPEYRSLEKKLKNEIISDMTSQMQIRRLSESNEDLESKLYSINKDLNQQRKRVTTINTEKNELRKKTEVLESRIESQRKIYQEGIDSTELRYKSKLLEIQKNLNDYEHSVSEHIVHILAGHIGKDGINGDEIKKILPKELTWTWEQYHEKLMENSYLRQNLFRLSMTAFINSHKNIRKLPLAIFSPDGNEIYVPRKFKRIEESSEMPSIYKIISDNSLMNELKKSKQVRKTYGPVETIINAYTQNNNLIGISISALREPSKITSLYVRAIEGAKKGIDEAIIQFRNLEKSIEESLINLPKPEERMINPTAF